MLKRVSTRLLAGAAVLTLLAACAGPQQHLDYTAFRHSRPRSIVVVPPINDTSDVKATYGMLSRVTLPLAESGYYVVPVGPMERTFKYNGLYTPNDIAEVSPAKLRRIFGADAALYMKVSEYGTSYRVIDSVTKVAITAKLVDLKTGDVLWQGKADASDADLGGHGGVSGSGTIGLFVMLAQAAVKQIAKTVTDESVDVAGVADGRLLRAGQPDGLLYGPYSKLFGTD
ncbi:DUF799 domain-containing protein [Burkholderia plantarii]|uniref:Putative lipoprotein n=1 Tax=Burkholderia plantarii TaxID=41899 RepID=A0A0B6RVZ9_BURPL|nr:DUF799 domain-containing protein [Burkholderia plantarii]AJK49522.1 putative lipoprotein [Burkholderia plantarii]